MLIGMQIDLAEISPRVLPGSMAVASVEMSPDADAFQIVLQGVRTLVRADVAGSNILSQGRQIAVGKAAWPQMRVGCPQGMSSCDDSAAPVEFLVSLPSHQGIMPDVPAESAPDISVPEGKDPTPVHPDDSSPEAILVPVLPAAVMTAAPVKPIGPDIVEDVGWNRPVPRKTEDVPAVIAGYLRDGPPQPGRATARSGESDPQAKMQEGTITRRAGSEMVQASNLPPPDLRETGSGAEMAEKVTTKPALPAHEARQVFPMTALTGVPGDTDPVGLQQVGGPAPNAYADESVLVSVPSSLPGTEADAIDDTLPDGSALLAETVKQKPVLPPLQPLRFADKGDLAAETTVPVQSISNTGSSARVAATNQPEAAIDSINPQGGTADPKAGSAQLQMDLSNPVLSGDVASVTPAWDRSIQTSIPSQPPSLAPQIAAQITQAVVHKTDDRIEVILNPQELGRVRISLAPSDHVLNVIIHADRPDIQDLLRRHIDLLGQDFRDLGYRDVQFRFGDQGQHHSGSGHRPGPEADFASPVMAEPVVHFLPADRAPRAGGLDIRI